MKDLLTLEGLSNDEIVALLDASDAKVDAVTSAGARQATLSGRLVALLFLEDSTRTRCSFAIAAKRLGADCVTLGGKGSSVSKGESIVDTALNIEAMGVDAMVLRCAASGGAALVADAVACPVVNGGDGRHEHPTQGLLDMLTLRRHLGGLEGKRIAIVGDVSASRVARSNLHGLTTLGAEVVLVGPPPMAPKGMASIAAGSGRVTVSNDLDDVLPSLDAIMMLRVQFERGSHVTADYHELYGLTESRADRLPAGAPVLHPGPMNRGLEIDSAVADGERSVILEQVTAGVAVRMAVLEAVLL